MRTFFGYLGIEGRKGNQKLRDKKQFILWDGLKKRSSEIFAG